MPEADPKSLTAEELSGFGTMVSGVGFADPKSLTAEELSGFGTMVSGMGFADPKNLTAAEDDWSWWGTISAVDFFDLVTQFPILKNKIK